MTSQLISLALYLLAYCVLHSWLASNGLKAYCRLRWPELMRGYRLLYNLLAVLLLLPLLILFWLAQGPLLWHWQGVMAWLMNGLALLALLGFISSLKDYDLSQFSGTAQWRGEQRDDPEQQAHLRIGRWHRWVRHPWYFFALVLIWTRSMDAAQLLVSAAFTLYFIVGSKLEEAKLLVQFGEPYRRYCQSVPGLIPLPWCRLTEAQASELERLAWVEKSGAG